MGKVETRRPCDNYEDCAKRHLNDADFLFRNNRLDNAIYLAGFAIECALKFAVEYYQSQGYGLSNPPNYHHRVHDIAMDLINILSLLPNSSALSILNQIQSLRNSIHHPLYGHPNRRYWPSGHWRQNEVQDAINLARNLYQNIVVPIQITGRLP